MGVSLAEDYAACRAISRRRGANFSLGLRWLPPRKRRAAEAVYAFCRYADDIADEPGIGLVALAPAAAEGRGLPPSRSERPAGPEVGEGHETVLDCLAAWEEELDRAYFSSPHTPIGRALADAVRRFAIPAEPFRLLIQGGRADQEKTRYADEPDFLSYCRLVAWTISDLTLPIFGFVDDRAREWGRELSTALQRTNVLRDVGEDAARGRFYLPADARARHGVAEEDLREGRATPAFLSLMKEEIEKALGAFRHAERLLAAVAADARLCVALLGGVYRAILKKIESDPGVALSGKASLTASEKFLLVARAAHRAAAGRWP